MKIFNILFLIIFALLVLILPYRSVYAASTHISFQKDADWSGWVQKDVSLVGSDGGLRLKSVSGNYEPSGTILYKVSPDGLATWGAMTQAQSAPSGTSIDFSFSSNEMSIDQTYADTRARADVKANSMDVGTSDFLYIRIDLFADMSGGVGVATPTLNSFGLDYIVAKTPTVYTEKHIYRYREADTTPLTETATFVPGDMAVVKIKLSATNAENTFFKVQDTLSRSPETFNYYKTKNADAVKYCGLSGGDILLGEDYDHAIGTNPLTVDGISLDGVSGYICYSYFIPTPSPATNQAKNDIQQVRLSVSTNDLILATSSNYLMVKGLAYKQSDLNKAYTDLIQIEDELLFSFDKFIFKGLSGQDISYTSAPSYAYKRGTSSESRGGNLYNLPVTVTDSSGVAELSSDSFYLLYNPSVYVMGNLFSKNSLPDTSLDFGSKNNVVSGDAFDSSSKINAQASLYNYNIDSGSVAYWNSAPGQARSQAMQKNIDRIVGTPGNRPENFCDSTLSSSTFNVNSLASGSLYLNNNSCNITSAESSSIWPDGRVWYFEPTGDVELSAKIQTSGTMVFNFENATSANVNITFHDGSIASKPLDFAPGANLGIILMNGGNVKFTKDCQIFNGMVFVPGK